MLGDMGGMYDALFLIGLLMAAPAAEYNLRALYLTRGFSVVEKSDPKLTMNVLDEGSEESPHLL